MSIQETKDVEQGVDFFMRTDGRNKGCQDRDGGSGFMTVRADQERWSVQTQLHKLAALNESGSLLR